MKPVGMGDAIALARALRAAPEADWPALIARILAEAEAAADFAKAHRRTHPFFGNGSVMAACAGHPQVPEPWLSDRVYCRCLGAVFRHLAQAGDVQ